MSDVQVAAFPPQQPHMSIQTDQELSNDQGPSTPPDQDNHLSANDYNQTPVDPRLASLESAIQINQEHEIQEDVPISNGEGEMIQDDNVQTQSQNQNQIGNESTLVPQHTGQICRYVIPLD